VHISRTDAKGPLTAPVKTAEAGAEVILVPVGSMRRPQGPQALFVAALRGDASAGSPPEAGFLYGARPAERGSKSAVPVKRNKTVAFLRGRRYIDRQPGGCT
jgi:hypothetical protein